MIPDRKIAQMLFCCMNIYEGLVLVQAESALRFVMEKQI